ncbi:holo-ACP synthase [Salinibacterium sp. G-O1]|uniref:holo-ACP synthase n=1 Tax=Salinibacterium sp. G-O1 TaxID=3046208 RepID=UPI0024BBA9DF|nr:holo-ACP synthase [Salinibacterium sp. G-O1]MDJ0334190.1 holo-ACP synthase [Salinibacterium sp. G-O1]
MIVGIGVDLVDIARFEHGLQRTPALISRLFAESEQVKNGKPMPLRSLAGRFAAKEAFIKALGDSTGVTWHDLRVESDHLGNPSLVLGEATQAIADAKGITSVHLSMSHDAGVAIAYVIVESTP